MPAPLALPKPSKLRFRAHPKIVEERAEASQLSRAVGILVWSMGIMKPSGVAETICAETVRFEGTVFHRGARPLARLPLDFASHTQIWGLPQDRTETYLWTALAEFVVVRQYGTSFQSLQRDDDGATVVADAGDTRADDYLIGADGRLSPARSALSVAYPYKDLDDD